MLELLDPRILLRALDDLHVLAETARGAEDRLNRLEDGFDEVREHIRAMRDDLDAMSVYVRPMHDDLDKVEKRTIEVAHNIDLLRDDLSGLPFIGKS